MSHGMHAILMVMQLERMRSSNKDRGTLWNVYPNIYINEPEINATKR